MNITKSFCRCLFILLITNFCSLSYAQNPSLPPSSNFDLSAWKLQTLDTGLNFTEIQPAVLTNGYSTSFFYTDPSDGSMVFRVPSNGTPTSGSTYPRVELRQLTNGANWILNDPNEHYLTAQCKVLAVADAKPQTIIGQIHGSNTVSEMLKLRWTGYKPGQCYVEARFKSNNASMAEYGVTLASGLSLGDLITYTITMQNGTVNCTVNGTTGTQTYTPDVWTLTDAYYFKAGNYLQYNPNSVSPPDPTVIYGQNQFYKLSLIKQTTEVSVVSDIKQVTIYPNPANERFQINYELSSNSIVSLAIYNLNGELVKMLISNQSLFANTYYQTFDISTLPIGVYLVKLKSQSSLKTIKLSIIK
jgi:hypothetical protein